MDVSREEKAASLLGLGATCRSFVVTMRGMELRENQESPLLRRTRQWGVRAGVFALLFCLVGCKPSVEKLDAQERGDVLMRKAASKERANDLAGAVDVYEQITVEQPLNALAHLQLAILLADFRNNYVSALYHYKVYLRLRPDAEKSPMIQERIRESEGHLAKEFEAKPGGASDVLEALNAKIASQQTEIKALQAQLVEAEEKAAKAERETARLRRRLRIVEHTEPLTENSGSRRVRAITESGGAELRSYRVQRGDSLSSIAKKMYDDAGKWPRIRDANKGRIVQGNQVRVGQVLVIPREEE